MTELDPFLKDIVQTGFDIAKSQFEEGKEVLQQVTLYAEGDDGGVVAPIMSTTDIFGSRNGIPVLPTLIQGVWGRLLCEKPSLQLVAISLLMDGWIGEVSREKLIKEMAEGSFVPLSQRPGSQEAILVQLTLPGEDRMFKWPYGRVGKEVIFAGEPEEANMKAVFPGLWPV